MGGSFELANAPRWRAGGAHPPEEGALRAAFRQSAAAGAACRAGRPRAPRSTRPAPTGPMLLGRLGLHVDLLDRDRQRLRDALAHGQDVRRHLRRLRDDGAVDVADLPAGLRARGAPASASSASESAPRKLRVGVGEVVADVAQRGGAEQRVGDRVAQRVGVGVAEQAVRVRDRHAAQHQRAARHQRVRVPAFADADVGQVHGVPFARAASSRSASAKSRRPGDLEVLESPAHEQRAQAQRLDGARFVGHRRAGRARAPRAACPGETSAASAPPTCRRAVSVAATRPPLGLLQRVGHRQREQAADLVAEAGVDQRGRPSRRAPGSAPRRAPAPSRARARRARAARPARRPPCRARCAPPQRGRPSRARPRSRARAASKRSSSGASTTSVAVEPRHLAPAPPACAPPRAAGERHVLLGHRRTRARADAGTGHAARSSAGRSRRSCRARAVGRREFYNPRHASPRREAPRGAFCFVSVPPDAASLARPRQALHPAPPARLGRCAAAGALRAGAGGAEASSPPSSPPSRPTRSGSKANCPSSRPSCASPCSPTGRRCPTTPSRRTRT